MRWAALLSLFAIAGIVWSVPLPPGLSVSFLDVGQGDAIFIQTKDGVEFLIDGGPDSSVLRELGARLPFWDREIDAVLATHPDKDHIGGLVDVLKRYEVKTIIDSGVEHDTSFASLFEKGIAYENAERIVAKRGIRFMLGGDVYADVLYPVTPIVKLKDTNSGSVIVRVVYGETSVLLTGDAPAKVERALVSAYGEKLKSTILKAGHHGSKTSSDESFLRAVNPDYAVYSRGCDNTYGHPAPEVVLRFEKLKIPTLDTCEGSRVTFESNGVSLRRATH